MKSSLHDDPPLVAPRDQQLASILSSMGEGMVMLDRDGRIVEANPAAEQLLSLTREQFLDPEGADVPWEAMDENGTRLERGQMPVSRTLRSGVPSRGTVIGIRIADGPVRWLSVNAEPLFNGADPEPSGAVGTFLDVTALRESVERIRTLMKRVEDVRAEERRELGLLLHEGIAQDLFSMRLALGNLQRELQGAQLRSVQEIAGIADRALAETRQLARQLRPTAPDHQPIGEIIAQHARYFEGVSGLRITVQHEDCPAITDDSLRQQLFRAAQEALTNIARHAQATRVELSLRRINGMVELRVTDDGIGVQPGALEKAGSLGMLGMSERARAAGGSFRIEGGPEKGTILTLTLPLGA
jgi:PAS domain S-box-containing protein